MKQFSGPVPGESLTATPRNSPWERPPETADEEKALVHHLERLSQPEVEDNILDAIEMGLPIEYMTELVTTGGVANAIHSIDVGLIISPVIHEYLVSIAEASGMPYKEFFSQDNNEKETEEMKKKRSARAVAEALKKAGPEEDAGTFFLQEIEQTIEEQPTEEKTGLMARKK